MPLLSLLLVFSVIFLLFVLALVWVQWQKHTRPIAHESVDDGVLGASLAADAPRPQLGRVVPQAAMAEAPRDPIGPATARMAAEQRATSYEGKISFRTQLAVTHPAEPYGGGRPASDYIEGSGAVAGGSAEPGRISYADAGRQDSARFATGQTFHREVEERNVLPKELADATWLRFHYQTPALSREGASAKVGTPERLHATIHEIPPDRLGKTGLWRLFPSGRNNQPRPQQDPIPHPHMVMATPYLRTALRLCSEIQRDDAPQIESRSETIGFRSEIDDTPRVRSEKERLLVLALWWIMVPAAVVFAFFPSKSIDMRLKPEPPAEFFYHQGGWDAKQQSAEETLARDYWACAVQSIQYQYASNKDLPVEPPPQFNIEPTAPERNDFVNNSATRDRYWENLREVWTRPEVWEESYVTNPSWVSDLFSYLQGIFRKYTTTIRKLS